MSYSDTCLGLDAWHLLLLATLHGSHCVIFFLKSSVIVPSFHLTSFFFYFFSFFFLSKTITPTQLIFLLVYIRNSRRNKFLQVKVSDDLVITGIVSNENQIDNSKVRPHKLRSRVGQKFKQLNSIWIKTKFN